MGNRSLIAASTIMGVAGALTQYKSQTQKNNNKEMPHPESVGTQLAQGCGWRCTTCRPRDMASARAGERGAAALNGGRPSSCKPSRCVMRWRRCC